MRFLRDYITEFEGDPSGSRKQLAKLLQNLKATYDLHLSGRPIEAFEKLVEFYNWLGDAGNKRRFDINQNLARNLPGALMQDYLVHLALAACEHYPRLDVFSEVRVRFGHYPLWLAGEVEFKSPSEQSDIAIGYVVVGDDPRIPEEPWPRHPYFRLASDESVWPLVTINSKIRVSQSEFFDWLGREQLMTKGNPHCLSIQVALRKEMDSSIIEASQAADKFFLLGHGGERSVVPDKHALDRLIRSLDSHLAARMTHS
jgi:hypothetical protein